MLKCSKKSVTVDIGQMSKQPACSNNLQGMSSLNLIPLIRYEAIIILMCAKVMLMKLSIGNRFSLKNQFWQKFENGCGKCKLIRSSVCMLRAISILKLPCKMSSFELMTEFEIFNLILSLASSILWQCITHVAETLSGLVVFCIGFPIL